MTTLKAAGLVVGLLTATVLFTLGCVNFYKAYKIRKLNKLLRTAEDQVAKDINAYLDNLEERVLDDSIKLHRQYVDYILRSNNKESKFIIN